MLAQERARMGTPLIGRRLPTPVMWTAATVALLLAFAILGAVASAVAPAPTGPALSSYATTPGGLAAWAQLLERDGHAVSQIRRSIGTVRLPADATVVSLGGGRSLSSAQARALARFVARGGWLVVSGSAGMGTASRRSGRGRVVVLANASFLENRALGTGDNAYRALVLAGPPRRPVVFDEAVHGYRPATGLAALPERWWFAIGLLALALAAWALSRALRLGGSDPVGPEPARPRGDYVEAMAQTLVRTEGRDKLARRVEEAAASESVFRASARSDVW